MAKVITILGFLLTIGLALHTYFSLPDDDKPSSPTTDAAGKPKPMLELEDFSFISYERHQLLEQFSGGYGFFLEPNVLQSIGNNHWQRFGPSREQDQEIKARIFTFHLAGEGISLLLAAPKLLRTELNGEVQLIEGDKRIDSPYATYDVEAQKVVSDRKVTLTVGKNTLSGSKGFLYDVAAKDLEIFGPITGKSLPPLPPSAQ